MDISDIFYFFLLGRGEGGDRADREGGGSVFYWKSQAGGGVLPKGVGTRGGWEGVCGEFGGGGLNICFRGRNAHQVSKKAEIVNCKWKSSIVSRKLPTVRTNAASTDGLDNDSFFLKLSTLSLSRRRFPCGITLEKGQWDLTCRVWIWLRNPILRCPPLKGPPETSLTVEVKTNPEVPQKFPRLPHPENLSSLVLNLNRFF